MGSEVIAKCKCGLEKEILIGCGMNTVNKIFLFPCQCTECKDVVQGDLKNLECPQCGNKKLIPYDELQAWSLLKKRTIQSGYDGGEQHEITAGKYKCPACTKNDLRFYDNWVLWD